MRSSTSDNDLLATLRERAPELKNEDLERQLQRIRVNDPEIYTAPLAGRSKETWDANSILSAIKAPTLLMQADSEVGAAVMDDQAYGP